MKLLFITTQFPYPLDNGGKIGALNGINVVSHNYDVTVLSFTEEPRIIKEGIDYFKTKLPQVFFDQPIVHSIHIRNKPILLLKVMLKNYLKSIPYVSAKFENRLMYKKIDMWFEKVEYWDMVFIDYLNMSVYAEYIRARYSKQIGRMIFKNHNIEYDIIKQEALSSRGIKKLILNAEWKRTLKYEQISIKKADMVFSVCDDNTEYMKKYNEKSYTMAPTYEMLPHRPELTQKNNILYIGNLSWKANLDGVSWFVNNVFPRIKEVIPDVVLTIVGSGPSKNPFINIPGVKNLGYVKNINEIYNDQKVFIVPLFEGSGIRIKVLEAFNNEISVVATSMACETINAQAGKDILVANNDNVFAKSVIELLSNDILNNQMRTSAKAFLEEKFSLYNRQKEFEDIMNQ